MFLVFNLCKCEVCGKLTQKSAVVGCICSVECFVKAKKKIKGMKVGLIGQMALKDKNLTKVQKKFIVDMDSD